MEATEHHEIVLECMGELAGLRRALVIMMEANCSTRALHRVETEIKNAQEVINEITYDEVNA